MEALRQFLEEILTRTVLPKLKAREIDADEIGKISVQLQDMVKDVDSETAIENTAEVKIRYGGQMKELEKVGNDLVSLGLLDDKYMNNLLDEIDKVSSNKEFTFDRWKRIVKLGINGIIGRIGRYKKVE